MKATLKKELPKLTLEELVELQGEVSTLITTKQEEAKAILKAKMEEMAQASGMTVEEILGIAKEQEPGSSRKRKSPKPKYEDPETGKTWSGRGRMPRWLVDLAKEKKINLDDPTEKEIFLEVFLIEQPAQDQPTQVEDTED